MVEDKQVLFSIAEELLNITSTLGIPFIFKASFTKANRTSLESFTGIGDDLALSYLKEIKETFHIPITTDVHTLEDIQKVQDVVDIIQIPAFLCRQTALLVEAAKTGKPTTIKKGQFMSPESMQYAVQKVTQSRNQHVALIERGTMFGYLDLVVDYRGIHTMQQYAPTILDITHSVQKPNQSGGFSGGDASMIETIAKAGVAVGVDGLFMETHPNPSQASSDAKSMLPLNKVGALLHRLKHIAEASAKEI